MGSKALAFHLICHRNHPHPEWFLIDGQKMDSNFLTFPPPEEFASCGRFSLVPVDSQCVCVTTISGPPGP